MCAQYSCSVIYRLSVLFLWDTSQTCDQSCSDRGWGNVGLDLAISSSPDEDPACCAHRQGHMQPHNGGFRLPRLIAQEAVTSTETGQTAG